jgi:hypothetical protein
MIACISLGSATIAQGDVTQTHGDGRVTINASGVLVTGWPIESVRK